MKKIPEANDLPGAMPAVPDTLAEPVPPKLAVQSKEWWGEFAFYLGLIAGGLGVSADPTFMADGIQLPEEVVVLGSFLVAFVGALLRRYGARAATQPLQGIIGLFSKK